MKIETFIEKAIKGGWKYDDYCDGGCGDRHIFLDPLAWQAVGKVKGWKYPDSRNIVGETIVPNGEWVQNMHRMIDALAEGNTIEQFLETL